MSYEIISEEITEFSTLLAEYERTRFDFPSVRCQLFSLCGAIDELSAAESAADPTISSFRNLVQRYHDGDVAVPFKTVKDAIPELREAIDRLAVAPSAARHTV